MNVLNALFSLLVLTLLEIILGIDNLVFLAIVSQKLPPQQRKLARQIGLTLAWVMRLILLSCAIWIMKLTVPLFSLWNIGFSVRDLFMLGGGLFLLVKSTQEIHTELDHAPSAQHLINKTSKHRFAWVVTQLVLLDLIFSLDSVLTAIGLTQQFWLMATAITIAIITMLLASEPLARLIARYPSLKMLALSFLMLIGMVLIADGCEFHVPRGYVYFAMGFSLFTELLNILSQKQRVK